MICGRRICNSSIMLGILMDISGNRYQTSLYTIDNAFNDHGFLSSHASHVLNSALRSFFLGSVVPESLRQSSLACQLPPGLRDLSEVPLLACGHWHGESPGCNALRRHLSANWQHRWIG